MNEQVGVAGNTATATGGISAATITPDTLQNSLAQTHKTLAMAHAQLDILGNSPMPAEGTAADATPGAHELAQMISSAAGDLLTRVTRLQEAVGRL